MHVSVPRREILKRSEPATLPRWSVGKEYLRLPASFESLLPLERPSTLIEPMLAHKILSLAEGTLGEIVALPQRAALHAVESRIEHHDRRTAGLDECGYIPPSQRRRNS
jgi:hypothetical protein